MCSLHTAHASDRFCIVSIYYVALAANEKLIADGVKVGCTRKYVLNVIPYTHAYLTS